MFSISYFIRVISRIFFYGLFCFFIVLFCIPRYLPYYVPFSFESISIHFAFHSTFPISFCVLFAFLCNFPGTFPRAFRCALPNMVPISFLRCVPLCYSSFCLVRQLYMFLMRFFPSKGEQAAILYRLRAESLLAYCVPSMRPIVLFLFFFCLVRQL